MKTLKPTNKHSLLPKPPAHLSKEAASMWAVIVKGWHLDEAALIVLCTGLEAFMRMREAQAEIKKYGVCVEDRFGNLRANPAANIERDSRAALLSAFRNLGLDIEPIKEIGRPPGS